MCLTLGSLLQRLERDRDTGRRFSFFMPSACGPCRFGAYNLLHKIVLERLGWKHRVSVWSPMDKDYFEYVLETVQMAYVGALCGLLATLPLGWFGAYNMTPSRRFVYPVARFITMGCRAVHEMIWAILFVTIIGFGMLPGVLALAFFSTGFAAKLFAEEIEAIDMGPVEAIRASGANQFQVMVFGVFPQVRVAFTGIAIYTWDVAFRAATVVGFFGAGGMGWYLKRNILQIETERVAAILLSIVVLVLISEALSAWARARIMKAK